VVRASDLWLNGRKFDPGHHTISWFALRWVIVFGGHTTSVCNQPPRATQPPTLHVTGNEYRTKCSDALRLGIKDGMAHSICGWACGWQLKLRNLSALEVNWVYSRNGAIQMSCLNLNLNLHITIVSNSEMAFSHIMRHRRHDLTWSWCGWMHKKKTELANLPRLWPADQPNCKHSCWQRLAHRVPVSKHQTTLNS